MWFQLPELEIRAAEMLAIYCPPFGGHLDEPLPGPAASAVLAYYLCVRAATYEILKDHPVPVDVSNPPGRRQ
jgi:hypothetical protein